MYVQLSCAIIDADQTNCQEMTAFLGQFGVVVIANSPSIDQLPAMLQRPEPPQLVIVNLDPNAHETLKKLAGLPRQHPSATFFVMSQVLDANLLMEAMQLGVREFIPLPIQEQKFSSAIERVANTHGMGKKAKLINVVPTQGGCGATTIACNLAASLAKTHNAKVALIDMDLMRGGVAGYFDSRPRYTIADVMESAEKVDKQMLDNALIIHKNSGVAILARPELPEDTQRVNQTGLTRLLGVVSRVFDYVVVDSMMSIAPLYSAVITAADTNVVVMQLNVPSCRNAERYVGALRRIGIEASKIRIVANRYVKKGSDIEPEEVERTLGLKIGYTVPNDFKNAIQAINYGEPVVLRAPKSEISTSILQLASSLHNKTAMAAAA